MGRAAVEPEFSRTELPKTRVLISDLPGATDMFLAQPEKVADLFTKTLLHYSGKTNEASAWASILSPTDVVGIKVFASPGPNSGTRPAVVAAMIESLLRAKFSPRQIIVWDKNYYELRRAGFTAFKDLYGVEVVETSSLGWDDNAFYESSVIGTPVWGDLEFGKKGETIGRKSYVAKLITQRVTKIISVSPLLNHNLTGVTGHLMNLSIGNVDNSVRFEYRQERLSTAVPEIAGLPEIFDKVALCVTDALICQYQGEQKTLLHYSAALNQLRFSKDPVALDTLSLEELEQQRKKAGRFVEEFKTDLYDNASLLELGVSDKKRITVDVVR